MKNNNFYFAKGGKGYFSPSRKRQTCNSHISDSIFRWIFKIAEIGLHEESRGLDI